MSSGGAAERHVDTICEVAKLKPEVVRTLLDAGWSFTWDSKGNYAWSKNES